MRAPEQRRAHVPCRRFTAVDVERRRLDDDEPPAAGGRRARGERLAQERRARPLAADRLAALDGGGQGAGVEALRAVNLAVPARRDADDAGRDLVVALQIGRDLTEQPDEATRDVAESDQDEIERHAATPPISVSSACSRSSPCFR